MPETVVGFCSKCGIVREDYNGINVTDCICTAEKKHAVNCGYLKAVSCPISVGIYCKHGLEACLECDCSCNGS